MSPKTDTGEDQPRTEITYEDLPAPEVGSGRSTLVREGLHWFKMPLFGALESINVWAIDDGDGWTIIDSGMRSDETIAAWRTAIAGDLGAKPVKRLILTHMHGDHSGMAGWFEQEHDAPLWMTRGEYLNLRLTLSESPPAPDFLLEHYRRAGMQEDWIEGLKERYGTYGSIMFPLPGRFHPYGDEDVIDIGLTQWTVVVGKGHSPEHAALWEKDLGLVIAGDQALPDTHAQVTVQPHEPDANPLSDWLASLDKIRATIPDDVLVLPAHGQPYRGLHAQTRAIQQGFEKKLKRLYTGLEQPGTAFEHSSAIARRFPRSNMGGGIVIGETLAHLACLRERGLAKCERQKDGTVIWSQPRSKGM